MLLLHVLYCTCVLLTSGYLAGGQKTSEPCDAGSGIYYSLLQGLHTCQCCSQLRAEIQQLRDEVNILKCTFQEKVPKGTQSNPGRSCREIRQWGQSESGQYWINPDPDKFPFPIRVFCEMELLGGGWIRVFNMMAKPEVSQSAAEMYGIITRNAEVREVLSNTTSTAIYTSGLRLQEYTQAVFGWAPSADVAVTNYGIMTSATGLKGVCYVDSFCGNGKPVGTFTSSVSGNNQPITTGNNPQYPHVGMGYSGQVIVWGFDLNTKSLSGPDGTFSTHWGNWNADQECCLVGATAEIGYAGDHWRYSILIR